MNSLVLGIVIISSVLSLGYGTDLTFSLNDLYNQKAEVYPLLEKSREQPNSKFGLNHSMQSIPTNLKLDSLFYTFEVQLSATEWQWRVRKCGVFAAEVMTCWIRSHYDVLVDFEGFANPGEVNPGSPNGIQIGTWYAISQLAPPPREDDAWIPASELNNADFIIPSPVEGVTWNLWFMIEVTNQNRAAEYQDCATITFSLQGVEDWIEPEISLERKSNR